MSCHYLLAEKETSVSVNRESGTCPRIPDGVQCGRGDVDWTALELPARGGGHAWGQRRLHFPGAHSFSRPRVTVSDVYAGTLLPNSELPQTFSSAQLVHFVPLKSPARLLIILLENCSAS